MAVATAAGHEWRGGQGLNVSALPLVSVLIPCYNSGRWIRKTLESALAQTWPNIEIILVDDGSIDDSVVVVERLESRQIKLIKQQNAGAAAARNRAFKESSGEYIQYLDADDLLSPRKIELQMARLAENPRCVASAEWARFSLDPAEATFLPDETWLDLEPVEWLVRAWRDGGGMLYPALWLVPRQIVINAGPWLPNLSLNDDGEFFARVVLASDRILFCEGARTYYRSGIAGSLSGLKSHKGWESQFKVIDLCQGYLLAREDSDRTRRVCAMMWQRLAHASYPYYRSLANEALARARALHPEKLKPEGGHAFKFVSNMAGWKLARLLQRWSGRA
jgi:glycosyltransferase involved in cell wall biosynthesis